MCGIAGVVHFDNRPIDRELVRRMVSQIRHRGPDATGTFIDDPVGLGHARLSIIDLAGGGQPMPNEDRSIWVTFNGEIYNFVELRRELKAKGHHLASESDTEVILHLYEEYGDACVERLNGQWAFAVWDRRRRRLFASRDRFGIRPFYYTTVPGKFLFASEVKSLFVHPDVPRRIDPRGLNQVFTFWSPLAPRTVFENIRELPPGHCLEVKEGRVRTWPYWQLEYPADSAGNEQDYAEQLLELLEDATRLRLRSDVPVGAYLSGGLDSALTTALVKRVAGGRLRTFSIAFEDGEFDESRYQDQAVKFLKTEHAEIRCGSTDVGNVLPEVIRHAERPILRTAPAPLFMLSDLVRREGYKVVITGEGADEMFGGYDIFKEAKVRRFWAAQPESSMRSLLLKKLYPYLPNIQAQPLAYRKAFFHVRPGDLASPWFSHLPRWQLTARLRLFYGDQLRSALDGHDPMDDCLGMLPEQYGNWAPLCQAQFIESTTLLPGYILSSQGDRMSMAHGVEGRYPFLDHRLAEFAAALPPRMKMKGLCEKHILKKAARGLIPESIRARPKQPYRAPDAASLMGSPQRPIHLDYVDELLSTERIRRAGLFQPSAVEHLVRKVRSGRAIGVKDDMALVGIVTSQLLVDQFIENFQPRCETRQSEHPIVVPDIAAGLPVAQQGFAGSSR